MPLALAILDEEGTVDITKLEGYPAMLEKEQAAIPKDEISRAERSYNTYVRKYGRKHVKTRVRLDAWNKLRFAWLE